MKSWTKIVSWVAAITMAGCSVSMIYVNKPDRDVDIMTLQKSTVDTLDLKYLAPKLFKIKEPVSVDLTDSIK